MRRKPKELLERCSECGFRKEWCICNSIKKMDNKTRVLLITHAQDERKPSNTGKIIRASVQNYCLVRYGTKEERIDYEWIKNQNPVILFPNENAVILSKTYCESLYSPTLVILDGTWSQAAKLANKLIKITSNFVTLPQGSYNKYLLRDSGTENKLCSAQALIEALNILGEDTVNIQNAIDLFITKNLQIRGQISRLEK